MPSTMNDAPPGIGDVSQVAVPAPQVFFVNQPGMVDSVGRPTTPAPGNFTETPAFTGNLGKPEGSHSQL